MRDGERRRAIGGNRQLSEHAPINLILFRTQRDWRVRHVIEYSARPFTRVSISQLPFRILSHESMQRSDGLCFQ